jgi:hypothetical protein
MSRHDNVIIVTDYLPLLRVGQIVNTINYIRDTTMHKPFIGLEKGSHLYVGNEGYQAMPYIPSEETRLILCP